MFTLQYSNNFTDFIQLCMGWVPSSTSCRKYRGTLILYMERWPLPSWYGFGDVGVGTGLNRTQLQVPISYTAATTLTDEQSPSP